MAELKNQITDNEELKHAIGALKLSMFKGINNSCPKCNRRGEFGSIVKYKTERDNWYLICGWCGEITKTKHNSG